MSLEYSFLELKKSVEAECFKGWDPYDGLNSKVFQATPFKKWSVARLIWIQLFKRNPINLRKLFQVPKEYNPKALGLFLTAYSDLYKIAESEGDEKSLPISKEEIEETLRELSEKLVSLKSKGYSGSCWGYNFDWQARGGLHFPAYTPTVVATTFAVNGLLDAYAILKDEKLKKEAVSSAKFVINDLNRTPKEKGFLFSYSPTFGNNTVYNASLLGSKLLARVYSVTKYEEYLEATRESVLACCEAQNEDGSWRYGELAIQNWIDSFHTGFNLEAIYDYQKYTGDSSFKENFEKGFDYYVNNFFLEDGTPKYYNNETYPVDIHSPAQLIITLVKCNRFESNIELAEKVIDWTCKNMQDEEGYFYYQVKNRYKNKIPYMRWSQAWMMCALSYYLKGKLTDK